MTLGFSRDDAGSIIARYLQLGILRRDPFESVDIEGVGQMIRMAVERVRGGACVDAYMHAGRRFIVESI